MVADTPKALGKPTPDLPGAHDTEKFIALFNATVYILNLLQAYQSSTSYHTSPQ